MKTRPGVTLLEVLAAIFILGIGLLSLMTLFPLGAATMTQAMEDARITEAANNAKSMCEVLKLRSDRNIFLNNTNLGPPTYADSSSADGQWYGASYPVYFDPIRTYCIYNGVGNPNGDRPGDPIPLPRTLTPPRTSNFKRVVYQGDDVRNQWGTHLHRFSLLDDLSFEDSGSPVTRIDRESRYTWAYLLRALNAASAPGNTQQSTHIDVTVVVYVGRNLQIPEDEVAYTVEQVPDPQQSNRAIPNVVRIPYGRDGYTTEKPNLKKGGWFLDTTEYLLRDTDITHVPPLEFGYYQNSSPHYRNPVIRTLAQKYGPVHGVFYRVVDITDVTMANGTPAVEVEMQPPQNREPEACIKTIAIFDNVAGVFPIGTGWK